MYRAICSASSAWTSVLIAGVRQRADLSGELLVRIGIERSEPRGVHGRLRRKSRLEDIVCPVAQLGRRAEVERQREHAPDAGLAEALTNDVVDVDVCPAEAVDRLFRVAHDEQRAGPQRNLPPIRRPRERVAADVGLAVLREPEDDLGLDRIGVLELVHEQMPELLLQRRAHADVLAENAGREVEEVAVVEGVQAATFRRGRCASPSQQADREPIHVLAPLREIRLNDTREEVAVQVSNQRSQALLLGRGVRPPFLNDLRLAFPRDE